MEGITEIFAKNLNHLMKKHGENLSELSDRINVAYSTVSDWQHGKKMPRSGSLQKLADHFNVNISYLTSEHLHTNSSDSFSVDEAVDRLRSYQGKPVSDDQKAVLKDLIKGYLDRNNK